MLHNLVNVILIVILIYYFLLTIWYTFLFVVAFPAVIEKFKESKFNNIIATLNRSGIIPITVVTPVFNESERIINTVYAILKSDYKNIHFIIVNDGSTDNSLQKLIKEFSLYEIPAVPRGLIPTANIKRCYRSSVYKNFMVLDKEHSLRNNAADCINAGLNACTTPLLVTVDADTTLEPQALSKILFSFLLNKNCIGVGGSVYVFNENRFRKGLILDTKLPKKFVPAVQSVEYLRSFLYGRTGWNFFGGAMCFPGAFSLYETQILREVGGFDTNNFAYDAEMTTKIHHWMLKNKQPHCLFHSADAFGWTIVPNTLQSFWQQRNRWQRGLWRTLCKHFEMMFNRQYGIVGLISFPAFFLFEVLGPLIEFSSYLLLIMCIYLHMFSVNQFFWFVFLAWGYIAFLSVGMIFLNQITFNRHHQLGDPLRVLLLVLTELFGFRQYRALCCSVATLQFFFNRLRGKPL
jgi:biofilm PGA synthesis N-glycosyltransferase PgaC